MRPFERQDAVDESAVGLDEVATDQLDASVQIAAFPDHVADQFAHATVLDRMLTFELVASDCTLGRVEQVLDGERLGEQVADAQPHRPDGVARGGFIGEQDDRARGEDGQTFGELQAVRVLQLPLGDDQVMGVIQIGVQTRIGAVHARHLGVESSAERPDQHLDHVRVGLDEEVTFTGGVSKNEGMVRALEEELGMKVNVSEESHFMGAIGASLFAFERAGEAAA